MPTEYTCAICGSVYQHRPGPGRQPLTCSNAECKRAYKNQWHRAWHARQPEKQCSYPECDLPARHGIKSGYCTTHYSRWREERPMDGPPTRGFRVPKSEICTVPGCERPAGTKCLCPMHYARKRIHGDVGEAESKYGRSDSYVTPNGYRYVRIDSGKFRAEHRVVMEHELGRDLFRWEVVHHKNGNRLDNDLSNLELWMRRSGGHPIGQRAEDLVRFVVEHYPEAVRAALAGESQLRF